MRLNSLTVGLLLAGGFVAASGGVAFSAPAPAEIIKNRQHDLKELGGAMKTIVDQLKSGAADKTVLAAQATKISALSKDLINWFPKGTGEEAGVKTAAKPEIWTMADDFKAAAEKLPPETDKLAAAIETGDPAAIGAQLQATGKACGGCHKVFRVPPQEAH